MQMSALSGVESGFRPSRARREGKKGLMDGAKRVWIKLIIVGSRVVLLWNLVGVLVLCEVGVKIGHTKSASCG